MYVPKHFSEENREQLAQYMKDSRFATVVTSIDNIPYASHLPLTYQHGVGENGTLYGHVARANSHWNHFKPNSESLAIFTGPNAYLSPNWLAAQNAVPTWNYIAVHAYGAPQIVDNEDQVLEILAMLSADNETEKTGFWTADKMDQNVLLGLLKGIVAFKMPITRIEGKRKMSQNKPAETRRGAIEGLRQLGDTQSTTIADLMETGLS